MAEFSLDDDETSNALAGAGDVASAASAIVDNAPPVSPHVDDISGENVQPDDGRIIADDTEKDSAGVAWNAELHAATKAKTAKGEWKKRRGVGKLGASKKTAKVESAKAAESDAQLAAKAKMAGQVAAMSQFMVCSAIFGPEWKPLITKLDVPDGLGGNVEVVVNEMEEQSGLWGNWFLATGRTDFPPGIALAIGFLSYAGRRFTMPETQRRTSRMKEWFAQKIVSWKMRRADKKATANAPVDTRTDAKREDNTSNSVVSRVPSAR